MSKSSNTKAALLDAAEQAARARGHDGFSYADLARQVDIKTASIHYHYPAKADLICALMARYRGRIMDHLASIDDSSSSAADRLRGFVQMHRDATQDGRILCLCVALALGRDGLNTNVQSEIHIFREATLVWLRSVFGAAMRDGSIDGITDPDTEGPAALALVEGAQVSARAVHDVSRFDAAVQGLLARLG